MEIDEFFDKVERGEKIEVEKPKTVVDELLEDMSKKDVDKVSVCDKLVKELREHLERIENESASVQIKANSIKETLLEIRNRLDEGDMISVKKMYEQIKETIDLIPNEFYELKEELKKSIISVDSIVVPKLIDFSRKDFERKHRIIIVSIQNARRYMREKQIMPALNEYRRCQDIYHSMPEGFTKEKIELYIKIVELYKELLILAQISNLQNQLEF